MLWAFGSRKGSLEYRHATIQKITRVHSRGQSLVTAKFAKRNNSHGILNLTIDKIAVKLKEK